jgi:XTP/dITP diphosphohydrolase
MPKPLIAFATGSAAKVATARQHLSPLDIELEQVALELDEIQSASVQAVALHKARQAFQILQRPLIVEDSGFYIDEIGFPGPLVKYVINAIGAEGVARLADLTTSRRCHFESVLVHLDRHGVPSIYTDHGEGGTLADKPTVHPRPGAWSALWDVFIPNGCTKPLSALSDTDRKRAFGGWAATSVFAKFGQSLDPAAFQ